ncbi:MAG: CvpA family protein [Oscillospiraceae bacterium]|nr:CvpA family protein [Oscillospiraceae bacterium]
MIDIIIIAFIAVFLIIGYKKGLVITLLNMCSYLISIIAVFMFFNPVHTYLLQSQIGKNMAEKINTHLVEKFSGMPVLNLPLPMILKGGADEGAIISQSSASQIIAQNITSALFLLITFIVLYFAIKLVIKLVRAPLCAISSLPLIKQINKLGGAVLGVAMGFLWLYVLNGLIAAFSFADFAAPIADAVSKSQILGFLYENNFILNFIKI